MEKTPIPNNTDFAAFPYKFIVPSLSYKGKIDVNLLNKNRSINGY